MKVQYIIVDDEPIAHRVIEKYAKDLSFLQLKTNCYDALQALNYLNQNQVDLMFLDINMPELKGFDFLRTLERPPQVIVTSAYQEYALEGFELSVCDYLLKPFSFERFLKAVNKASDALAVTREKQPAKKEVSSPDALFLKGEKKLQQVLLDDILYVEASGNNSLVFLTNSQIQTSEKISDLERLLGETFIRIHKSFVVAADKITAIEGNRVLLGKKALPIGRVYRAHFMRFLSARSQAS